MLAQQTIEQVKAYNGIVEVISDYVTLRKRGRNHIGLCPFHGEKTPSFTVSPEKGIFHCFGCHESGDTIGFMRRIDNLSFREAIIHIAQKANIEVVEEDRDPEQAKRFDDLDKIQAVLFDCREKFKDGLIEGTTAHRYLKERGLSDESITDFHLGYAGDIALLPYLKEKGHSQASIEKAGIIYKNPQGAWVNRFRDRVIFPIIDYRSRTVGFGGRTLRSGDVAKYVNSDESPMFNKRRLIYGLENARKAIQKSGYCLLMEGYMDVIMAHQYGFKEAIATMGTAVTADHAQKIKRFTNKVYLAFDGDQAGQNAIEKSYDVLNTLGLDVFVLPIKQQDPLTSLKEKGQGLFANLIEAAIPMFVFKFQRACATWDPRKIDNIPQILESTVPILKLEKDLVKQRHFVKKMADQLQIEEELIMAKLKKSSYNVRKRLSLSSGNKKNKIKKAEEALIAWMGSDLAIRKNILSQLGPEEFVTDAYKALVATLAQYQSTNQDLIEQVEDPVQRRELSRILLEIENPDSGQQQWTELIKTLKKVRQEQRVNDLKSRLKVLEAQGPEAEDETNQLLLELQAAKKGLGG